MVEQQPPQPLHAPLDHAQGGGSADYSRRLSNLELQQLLPTTRSAIGKIHEYTLAEIGKYPSFSSDHTAGEQMYTAEDIPSALVPSLPERYAETLPLYQTALALLDEQLEGREVIAAFLQETLNPVLNARGLHIAPRPQEASDAMRNYHTRMQNHIHEYTASSPPLPVATASAHRQANDAPTQPPHFKANQPFVSLVSETSRWASVTMQLAGDPRTYREVTNPHQQRYLEVFCLLTAARAFLEENTVIEVEEPPGKRWRVGASPTGIDMETIVFCLNDALAQHNLMVDVLPSPRQQDTTSE
jgi:hypothetical protein